MNVLTRIYLLFAVLIMIIATGCGAAPAPTATPVPPTSTPEPTAVAASAEEILLVTGEFAPYTSETLEGGGMMTEIVAAVFAEMDMPIRIEFYPWERCEAMVESGEAWGTFPYVPTEERRSRFMTSNNLGNSDTYFYFYGDTLRNLTYTELSDLQPYRIGVTLGNWYIPRIEDAGLTTDSANDELASLRKLRAGRIDLVPIVPLVAQSLIQNNFPEEADQFGFLATPLSPDDAFAIQNTVIVSQPYANSEAILDSFNAALVRVIENGVYAEIVAKYGLTVEQLFGAA